MSLYLIFSVCILALLVIFSLIYLHYLHASHISLLAKRHDTYERIIFRLRFSHHLMVFAFWVAVITLGYGWMTDMGSIMRTVGMQ